MHFVGFENYVKLFHDPQFFDAAGRTILFVIFAGVLGQEAVGFLMAYLMRTHSPKFRRAVGFTSVVAWCCPMVVASYIFLSFFEDKGTLNMIISAFGASPVSWLYSFPLVCIFVAQIWKGAAYASMMFQASFDNISNEITESARLDGASNMKILTKIYLPILKPTIATVSMIITLNCIGAFGLPYAMLKGGPSNSTTTLAIYMYKKAFVSYQLGAGTAIAIIMLLVGVLFAFIYIKVLSDKDGKKVRKH
ncbi:MAG: carbohydrate ABC transporter permease [Candidatus Limivicinus sp.]